MDFLLQKKLTITTDGIAWMEIFNYFWQFEELLTG
jgi:hypothetical protein